MLRRVSSTNKPIISIPKSEESNRSKFDSQKIARRTINDVGLVIVDKIMPAIVSALPGRPRHARAITSNKTTDKPSVSERSCELIGRRIAALNKQNHPPMNSKMDNNNRW